MRAPPRLISMNMKNENPTAHDPRVMASIKRHNAWMRILTGFAVAFWLLAVAGSASLLGIYDIVYRPKEKQFHRDMENIAAKLPKQDPGLPGQMTPERALSIHYTMTYVLTKGVLVMISLTIVLSAGTLMMLIMVVMQR